jgi:isoleucyl-tRNA synthetase
MQPVSERPNFVKNEEEIAKLWVKIDAFQTSLKMNADKPLFNFYDGPPFATGKPHYGHILAGTIKDTITRYAHQTGHNVPRRFGWDCHGLPIEFEIDKQKGIKTKEDVLNFGIANYNEACRSIVMTFADYWKTFVTRLGRWIDFDNDYKTMDLTFMESVWNVLQQLNDKELIYRGFKVMPYSTRCATPISNFEANMPGCYKLVSDPSVIVSFPLVSDPTVSFVAWTTTPWTLPSNLALCVHPELDYVTVKHIAKDAVFILMKARLCALFKAETEYEILKEQKGKDLVGIKYVPMFDYFLKEYGEIAFKIVADTYVTTESGTGIVHQAPGFGEDDYRVCLKENLIKKWELPCPVDDNGRFTAQVTDWAGIYIKEADPSISKAIKAKGRMVNQSSIHHKYPFCWRSDTPLIYKAVPSWFVSVEQMRSELVENNKQTHWVPEFVKEKRFHNWLSEARDWSISRNRYWGTPIPIWVSEDYEEKVFIGSVAELEAATGAKVTDLHCHHIDHLTIPSKMGKGVLRRVPEVFDCWFESGSMPYAQAHYPFENKETFLNNFPADFIAEGIDQTRGWFYTLMVLSTALFKQPPFKNLIVNGLVLADDGKKMSKSLQNYPDPMAVIDKYGADCLRLYLINSPLVKAEKMNFKESGVAEVIGEVYLRWYNAYRLFYQNTVVLSTTTGSEYKPDPNFIDKLSNIFDKWILAYTQSVVKFTRQEMEAYRLSTVVPKLVLFISDLANWYCRLNRPRLKGAEGVDAQQNSLDTLYTVLNTLCSAMAPFSPFFVEHVYQNLRLVQPESERMESVHYLPFPVPNEKLFNEDIERIVNRAKNVIQLGRQARDKANMPIKQPLKELIIFQKDEQYISDLKVLESYIKDEVNVKQVTIKNEGFEDSIKLKPAIDRSKLGKRFRKELGKIEAEILTLTREQLLQFEQDGRMMIQGNEIVRDEITLSNEFVGDGSNQKAAWNDELLLVLNLDLDDDLKKEGIFREVTNRVQRLRKKAGLFPTDSGITAVWKLGAKNAVAKTIEDAIAFYFDAINKKGKVTMVQFTTKVENPLASEDTKINGVAFSLSLVRQ